MSTDIPIAVSAYSLNNTPAFKVPSTFNEPWRRGWGAVKQPDGWVYPAYYPFGLWAYSDIRRFAPTLPWDQTTTPLLKDLQYAEKEWKDLEKSFYENKEISLPVEDTFFDSTFPPFRHQRYGIARALLCRRIFYLWEMGTGKTRTLVETIRILRRKGETRKTLVIAPPIVGPTWVREVERWSRGELSAKIWLGEPVSELDPYDVVICSYARARISAKKEFDIFTLDYDKIIADESHSIGNWDSEQTKAVLALSTKAQRRFALSGTAADNPRKLYPQLRFLSPGLMPISWDEYQNKYLVRSDSNKNLVVGFKWMNELNSRVDTVAIRMKKKDCLDLPEVTFIDVPFAVGAAQKARYNELVVAMQASFEPAMDYAEPIKISSSGVSLSSDHILLSLPHSAARLTKLMQVLSGFMIIGPDTSICNACLNLVTCAEAGIQPYTKQCVVEPSKPKKEVLRDFGNPKLETFKQLLSNVLEADDTNKVLVWASFKEELKDIQEVCKELKVGHVVVDGSNTAHIKEFEDKFQTDEKCRVYVGQVKSGVGITLTAANYSIYYSLPWDTVQYKQSLERNNRPGQKRDMTVYRLISDCGVDKFIASTLQFKEHIAFTLVEKIACTQCTDQDRCLKEGNLPFRGGCKYQSAAARPIAKVGIIEK